MSNPILKLGIATPFVLFNFAKSGSIESKDVPRYFVSLDHNRTCTKACTFKLTVIYVPDTFSVGTPTIIDNMLVSSVRQPVTYHYGYYDYLGHRHIQQQQYIGQVYTYSSDTNIANGTITYTIEGTSHVAELTSELAEIKGSTLPMKPSDYFEVKLFQNQNRGDGFKWLQQYYEIKIDHTDGEVPIPNMGKAPVLDLIMGTSNNITKNNGNIAKVGGLVSLSKAPLQQSMEELHNSGKLTNTAYAWYQRVATKSQASEFAKSIQTKLGTPFRCYVDDIYSEGSKYGTLYYVSGSKTEANNVFEFDFGNTYRDSDVLSFSVNYDGSVALAAASATDNVTTAVDAEGNPIGASNTILSVNNLSRNTFPTLSGFNEEMFFSHEELSRIMLYPFEANMTIMGQLVPNQLLDIIYVVVKLNGAEVPHLTGKYQILEINDNVSDSGFTTTFKLIRYVQDSEAQGYMENSVSTSLNSAAKEVQDAIDMADKRNKIKTTGNSFVPAR